MFEQYYSGKKVLITGASGFKGSWMAIWLQKLGADVYGYSHAPKTEWDNYVTCGLDTKINHQNSDIRDLHETVSFFKAVQPEIVFHLAAQPIVLESYKNPVDNYSTNVMGTVNVLEAIRHTESVKVVVNVTTDKVYKNVEQVWGYREEDQLAGKDPYSASKSCSEIVTDSYRYSFFENRDIRIATARAGNVIGGGDWADDRIVPDFYRAMMSGNPLSIRNPYATRPWQHVLESLSGYLELGRALSQSEKYEGGWNFGPQNRQGGKSVGSLIDELKKYNPSVEVIKGDQAKKENEAQLLTLDVTKSATYLNWQPILSFEETVLFTQEGYKADIEKGDVLAKRLEQINSFEKKMNYKG